MIPRASIVAIASEEGLMETTVDKDYVLGWLLYGIAQSPRMAGWVFKGGTCLKKCFFETYRFSEDLDFTVQQSEALDEEEIKAAIREVCAWVQEEAGIAFPAGGLSVEQYTNKQGTDSFRAKLTYEGPHRMQRSSLQRVKFDITSYEVLVDPPDRRAVFHRYEDAREPAPRVPCYSVNEILAEKTRALYERQGRSRDLYDVVQISRNFRSEINGARAVEILQEKFRFKGLPTPTVDTIMSRIDWNVVEANWSQELGHQLPKLAPLAGFREDVSDALAWWMEPTRAAAAPEPWPTAGDEEVLAPIRFAAPRAMLRGRLAPSYIPDSIRFAARNRLCVSLRYNGVHRIVEPYSLRRKATGNVLLYVHELQRGNRPSDGIKSFKVGGISNVEVLDLSFAPRWAIEL